MRVIAGLCKGMLLEDFDHPDVRPTKDIVKESVFNSLMNLLDFQLINVCDLFAGTGGLGIEALSRGARRAVFVESGPEAADLIQKNLVKTRLGQAATVYREDVFHFLDQPARQPFDLILADPPYRLRCGNFIIEKIIQNGYLKNLGILVLETSPDEAVSWSAYPSIELYKKRRFGESFVTILKYHV